MRSYWQQEQVRKRLSRRRWWLAVLRQLHATVAVVQGNRAAAAAERDDDSGAEKDTLPVNDEQADAAAGNDTQSQPIVASADAQGTIAAAVGWQRHDSLAITDSTQEADQNYTEDAHRTQEQDAGESQHTGTGHTDAQGTAAANAGKKTQDSLAAGILAGDNQCDTDADTTAGNDTQRAADANGQEIAGGIGDKTKQEREAIAGLFGFSAGNNMFATSGDCCWEHVCC